MTLPLGGEEAVRGFEKFITTFLPESHRKLNDQVRSGKVPRTRTKDVKQQVMSQPTVDVEDSLRSAFSFMELPTKISSK